MNNIDINVLINAIKEFPSIWNVASEQYKNKTKRNRDYDTLSMDLRIDGIIYNNIFY